MPDLAGRHKPRIRSAMPADAAAIAAVQVASWKAAYRGLLPDDVLAGLSAIDWRRSWAARLADPPARSAVLLAEVESGDLAGFSGVGPSRDPAAPADEGQLYTLYLRQQYWNRGIGLALHSAALRTLAELGYRSAALWVLETNARAITFYRRTGWDADGARQLDQGPGGVQLPEIRLRRHILDVPK